MSEACGRGLGQTADAILDASLKTMSAVGRPQGICRLPADGKACTRGSDTWELAMPRTPNYNQERRDRDRIKAEKKAEKLASKAAKKEPKALGEAEPKAVE